MELEYVNNETDEIFADRESAIEGIKDSSGLNFDYTENKEMITMQQEIYQILLEAYFIEQPKKEREYIEDGIWKIDLRRDF